MDKRYHSGKDDWRNIKRHVFGNKALNTWNKKNPQDHLTFNELCILYAMAYISTRVENYTFTRVQSFLEKSQQPQGLPQIGKFHKRATDNGWVQAFPDPEYRNPRDTLYYVTPLGMVFIRKVEDIFRKARVDMRIKGLHLARPRSHQKLRKSKWRPGMGGAAKKSYL